jgi:CRP-like cAMP-binding protein
MKEETTRGLAAVRAAFAGTSLPTHGFLPSAAPSDVLPAPFDAYAEACGELASRYHGPGKDVRAWLSELFGRPDPCWREVGGLSQAELDAAMTAASMLAHAFRWAAMPPPPASFALTRIDLPPGLDASLVALAQRLDVPPCGGLYHLVVNNWRARGVAPGTTYDPAVLRPTAEITMLWPWLLPPAVEGLTATALSIVETEAASASLLLAMVKLLESAARGDVLESGFLLDKLRAGIVSIGRVFVEFVRPARIRPEDFMNLIQPHMSWGLERDGHRLDGASGAQSPVFQALDAVFGIARGSRVAHVALASRAYLPPCHRRFLDALDGVTHVVSDFVLGSNDATSRQLFNECVEGLVFWRRAHQKRGALYMRAEAANYASVSGVVEPQGVVERTARFEAEMNARLHETLDRLAPSTDLQNPTLANTFSFLSNEDLDRLLSGAERRSYAPSEVVLAEGSRRQGIFVVRKGSVRVHRVIQHEPVVIATLGAGEIFGEISFVDNSSSSAWVVARDRCEVDMVSRERVYEELADPAWGLRFFQSLAAALARRLRRNTAGLPALLSLQQRLLSQPRLSRDEGSAGRETDRGTEHAPRVLRSLAIQAETALLDGEEDAARAAVDRVGSELLAALAAVAEDPPAAARERAGALLRCSFGWLMASETIERAFCATTPLRPLALSVVRELVGPPRSSGNVVERWARQLPTSRWLSSLAEDVEARVRVACEAPCEEPVQVTLLDFGPSWSVVHRCIDVPLAVNCIDPDPSLRSAVEEYGARFCAADVVSIARGEADITFSPQRLVVADLLLSRLPDRDASLVFAWVHRSLGADGVAVFHAFNPRSPDRAFWDHLLQVGIERRGAKELGELARRAGFDDVTISASPDGAAVSVVCKKRAASDHETTRGEGS